MHYSAKRVLRVHVVRLSVSNVHFPFYPLYLCSLPLFRDGLAVDKDPNGPRFVIYFLIYIFYYFF